MNLSRHTTLALIALTLLAMPGLISASPVEQGNKPQVSAPFVLADGPGSQTYPALADNVMAYSDCYANNCHVHVLDLTTRQDTELPNGDNDQKQPSTDGQRVVWRDGRNAGSKSNDDRLNDLDIYAANLADRKEFKVTGAPYMQARPSVWGNFAVWSDFRDAQASNDAASGDIYVYDFAGGKESLVSNARSAQVRPVTNGRYVVWADYRNEPDRNGVNADIYGYDLFTRQEFPITTAPDTQTDPAISGNIVVWADWRKGDDTSDIYGYDLTPKKEFPITTAPGSQIQPAISGNIVVWTDFRNEPDKQNGINSDIYGYDLKSKQEFPIYVGPRPQGMARVVGNTVAWEDGTKGTADLDIMGATISGINIDKPPIPPLMAPGSGSRIFPETGNMVTGVFLDYWNKNGGLLQQGFPISGVMQEVSDLNGKTYLVQYFERAVFEYHLENKPPFDVLLSQLGTFRYKQKYPDGAPNQQPNTSEGSVVFPETGKRLGGKFLEYWQAHGGVAQQGYPISDEFVEKSDLNGKPYLVQYFERAVFELHPENQPPYDVLLSQLGTFRYKAKYGSK
jgi:beta propeller repeat protein